MSRGKIEFVLVDFGSNDGLKEWVVNNFQKELISQYLRLYTTEEMPFWNCSLAKNTAHLLAKGEVVVNLDCDNFTGTNGAEFVLKQFNMFGSNIVLHQFGGSPTDGSYGRISVSKKYFDVIGGYDQSFEPMGYQDVDLIHRLVKYGLSYVLKTNNLYTQAIFNTKGQSLENTSSNDTYVQMITKNKRISYNNLRSGNIIANDRIFGIRENLFSYQKGRFTRVNID